MRWTRSCFELRRQRQLPPRRSLTIPRRLPPPHRPRPSISPRRCTKSERTALAMRHYDHRVHAGNAGDVWKHFLLLEAADCLLTPDSSLVYAESHVGRPEYALKAPGDWEGGIGKIWPILPSLRNFCYFDILADLNPKSPSSVPAGTGFEAGFWTDFWIDFRTFSDLYFIPGPPVSSMSWRRERRQN